MTGVARRISGHGGGPGIEAAKEGGDEFQARWVKQERPLIFCPELLERGRDCTGLSVQLCIGQRSGFGFPFSQKGIDGLFRFVLRSQAEEFDQG